ncbi:radical SAM family heme chaperone HemW [Priestia koreensis]|uniref:radical SAM family heme chaperone HemW n=1 Tax=Priestia koreensis TaxID=284581 RepID=UPI00345A4287
MVKAAYLHIPFCHHICHYCDFNKVFFQNQPVEAYLEAMDQEMKQTVSAFPTKELETIFVGGGTPTALDEKQLEQFLTSIRTHLPLANNGEYTFEANPNELTKEKLTLLKEYGVNRLSIGVQTFNEELLKTIGRVHTNEEVERLVKLAKEMGFSNISLDLMYGLPGQDLEMFHQSIEKALELDVEHISSYSLIVEPKTVFYNLMRKGKLHTPSEDDEAKMYGFLMDTLAKSNFNQYEISNFAKSGYESRHNLTYWDNEEYYGIGAGAHGYVGGVRRSNVAPIKRYMDLVEEKGFAYLDEHVVTVGEQLEEEMFLGLRKTKGVSKERFAEKFGQSIQSVFGEAITEQAKLGLLTDEDGYVRLTTKGRFLGNEVFQAFLGIND